MTPLKPTLPSMLTTREAADRLNVSLPYVTKLIASGRLTGVQRTASGHRRIPLAEVERVAQEMRETRRAGLDAMAEISRPQLERELRTAKALRFLRRKGGEAPRTGDERD